MSTNPPSFLDESIEVRRIVTGKTLSEVLPQELHIPIWMPPEFVEYANNLVKSVGEDHPDLGITEVLEVIWDGERPETEELTEKLVLTSFKLSPVMMYQQVDRRLDE